MRAAIVRGDGAGAELVDEAVERAQLQDRLRSTVGRRRRGVEVLVAVASCAPGGRTTLVDRSLVERLVDWLAEHGFGSITVGAAGLGYSGRTPGGTPYDVVELADDLVPGDFPPGSASTARAWARADTRRAWRACWAACPRANGRAGIPLRCSAPCSSTGRPISPWSTRFAAGMAFPARIRSVPVPNYLRHPQQLTRAPIIESPPHRDHDTSEGRAHQVNSRRPTR